MDQEAIYLRLPIPLQHLACSFVGWRTERTRYGGEFPKILADAQARTLWSTEEIRRFRDNRLTEMVAHCAATVPFYRERLRDAGVDASDIRTIDDLRHLPILTKPEVQRHSDELVSVAVPARTKRMVHTSGTTGGALRFPITMRTTQEQWAVWWRYRGWHGIEKGTWSALFAGRSVVPSWQHRAPFWRVNHPGRQLIFSGYHMNPENLPKYVEELRRRRPPWLHGYPSLLALLAAHLLGTGSELGYKVRWVTIGAENLLPHQSDLIARALGVTPIQHYGLAEGVANISQCDRGAMHVDEDYAAIEFVPLGHDDLYRIVGTNLTNPAMPLVRYDTQDLATVRPEGHCSCGRPGRVVERVDGRLEDYVVLSDGTRIGRMDHIFKDMVNIHEAQIHQTRPGEMTIRVVRGPGYGEEDERELIRETQKRVGKEMDVKVEYVTTLTRSKVGKLRFVVSEIPGAAIEQPPTAAA